MINTKQLVVLAALEGLVMMSAVLRTVMPGGLDFSDQPTLIWFVAVMMVAGASITHFVLRNSMLAPRVKAGENVDDDRKQIFIISIAIVIGAGLLSAAGPSSFEKLRAERPPPVGSVSPARTHSNA